MHTPRWACTRPCLLYPHTAQAGVLALEPAFSPSSALPVAMLSSLLVLSLAQHASLFWGVDAQVSNAQCVSEYAWMSNSKGQSPCLVTAYLFVPCVGTADAVVDQVPSSDQFYLGPQESSECACNTVMYSLLTACERCQFAPDVSLHALPWSGWSENCTSTSLMTYPLTIPGGTAVPAWAFQDVTTNDRFDVADAEAEALQDLPDTTASVLPSSTSAPPTSTLVTFISPSSTSLTSTDSDSSSTSSAPTSASTGSGAAPAGAGGAGAGAGSTKNNNLGAIVGGVVGGVIGLLLVGVLVFYLLLRQRNWDLDNRDAALAQAERPMSAAGTDGGAGFGHQHRDLTPGFLKSPFSATPSTIYDPDDPRTFPAPVDPQAPPLRSRATSPTPSMTMSAHMRSLSASGEYPSQFGYGAAGPGYAGSVYKGAPEL
ncbi:hypothetical protein C8Q74DRAFT_779488 [Fomes fomentarius]|nr:hypothetical protein C8Q74DRAFT_779488 [Fomes fomentarius]